MPDESFPGQSYFRERHRRRAPAFPERALCAGSDRSEKNAAPVAHHLPRSGTRAGADRDIGSRNERRSPPPAMPDPLSQRLRGKDGCDLRSAMADAARDPAPASRRYAAACRQACCPAWAPPTWTPCCPTWAPCWPPIFFSPRERVSLRLEHEHALDLDPARLRQCRHLIRRACRLRLAEARGHDLIDLGEVAEIDQQQRQLDDIVQGSARR